MSVNDERYSREYRTQRLIFSDLLTTLSTSDFDYVTIDEAIAKLQSIKEDWKGKRVRKSDRWGKLYLDGTIEKTVEFEKFELKFHEYTEYGDEIANFGVYGIRELDASETAAWNKQEEEEKAARDIRDRATFEELKKKFQ